MGRDFHEMKIRALKPLDRGKTSNIQHRTPNAEVSEDSRCHSMFGVGCSMLDVPLGSWERVAFRPGEGNTCVTSACCVVELRPEPGSVCLALRGARLRIVPQANAVHRFMSPRTTGRLIGGALVIFVLIIAAASSNYVVQPGY